MWARTFNNAQGVNVLWMQKKQMVKVGIVVDGHGQEVGKAVFYHSSPTAQLLLCNVWTPNGGGSGADDNVGMHKASGALAHALFSAGYLLFGDDIQGGGHSARAYIGGRGDVTMEEALIAVMRVAPSRSVFRGVLRAHWIG
jgi:hypothetical protein